MQPKPAGPFRSGVSLKNGKLYCFSKRRVIVIRGWPEMAAWTKSVGQPQWCRIRPEINIGDGQVNDVRSRHRFNPNTFRSAGGIQELGPMPEHEPEPSPELLKIEEMFARKTEQISAYFSNVPEGLRRMVARFPGRHWHLLAMAARCPDSIQLLKENPALGFALASAWAFTPLQSRGVMRFIRLWSQRRRRVIAARLGFPDAQATVSILTRIEPEVCGLGWLLEMRRILADPAWNKTVRHLPRLNAGAMFFLCKPAFRNRVAPAFIHEMAEQTSMNELDLCLFDTMRMEKQLQMPRRTGLRSGAELRAYHDELVERMNREQASGILEMEFPAPPIQGTSTIVPLATPRELIDEAQAQHNCILSYARDVKSRSIYFYRMLVPERATLALVPSRGAWKLKEIAGPCNQPVSNKAEEEVQRWLESHFPF